MEMFFLILFVNREAIVLPEKYSYDQCEKVGKDWGSRFRCIPAPINSKYAIAPKCVNGRTSEGLVCEVQPNTKNPSVPGYYCGQYQENCIIQKHDYIDDMPKCSVNPTSSILECK